MLTNGDGDGRLALLQHIVSHCQIRTGNAALVRDLLAFARDGPFETVTEFVQAAAAPTVGAGRLHHRMAAIAIARSRGGPHPARTRRRIRRRRRRVLSASEALALGDSLPDGKRSVYEALIRGAQRPFWAPLVARALLEMVASGDEAEGVEAVAAWDCGECARALSRSAAYRRMHPGNRAKVASALQDAKLAPLLDPSGSYASHLHCVPRAVMDRHPDLWQLPVRFARTAARMASPDEAALLVAIGRRVVTEALLADGRRQQHRLRESRTTQVFTTLAAIRRAVAPQQSLRDALLAVRGIDDAVDLLARTVAHSQRRLRSTTRLPEDLAGRRLERLLMDFQTLVRCGVLESQGVPCDATVPRRALMQRMMRLEAADPERYRAVEAPPLFRPATQLSDDDVARLYAACRSSRETAVLALLAESAFRAGAVARARLGDVWDFDRRCVRDTIALWEKGSKLRRNAPNARLREALQRYIDADAAAARVPGDWLFPHARHPRRLYADGPRHVVAALCRRTGLEGISPHAFRRYVVNRAMRAGNRLEAVQKWLGHASAATTMRHYWTDDLVELDVTAARDGGLQEEVESLRARIAELEGDQHHPTTVMEDRWWECLMDAAAVVGSH